MEICKSKVLGRISEVKKMLPALAITFPAKDSILFGSGLHFLPQRLTGTETYWAWLDAHSKRNLNLETTDTGKVSGPQPVTRATMLG